MISRLAVFVAAVWLAQDAPHPSFEVATIKRNVSGAADGAMGFQPGWLSRERYDVTAKVSAECAAGSPEDLFPQLPLFVRFVLEDRFKLRVHRETRESPVYVLEFARKDRSPGPGLVRASADCRVDPDACRFRTGPGRAQGGVVAMATLTNFLAGAVDRFVVDRTGLDGTFRVELDWSPDQAGDAPSIFSALQEQLGLRLDAERAPVDVLVIDHVDRPTED